jgi:acetyl-CoA carboxylase carboxyltransferase component
MAKKKTKKTNELMRRRVAELADKRGDVLEMGGADKVRRQRQRGKLTARERIDRLFDADTFVELGTHAFFHLNGKPVDDVRSPADGVVTGFGKVNGRHVLCAAYDFTVMGGSIGEVSEKKVTRLRELALRERVPLVWLIDSAGARVHGGGAGGADPNAISLFAASGYLFREQVTLSGVVPQVAAMVGPGAAGTAYIPGLADFVPMVDGTSSMALGGPPLVRSVTGEDVSEEELGGAKIHTRTSGCADLLVDSDEACIEAVKAYLSFFPQSSLERPPIAPFGGDEARDRGGPLAEKLIDVLPESGRQAYDMRKLVKLLVDHGDLFEIKPTFARNIVTGLARIEGRPVGVLANNPMFYGGALDVDASDKAARFVNLCDAYGIPLVFLQDVPGFMVGRKVEAQGIIRHGAKFLYAVSEATVPKLTVVVRKAYGAGYYVMCGAAYEPDLLVAWPTAEISVMGPEGMVSIAARRFMKKGESPAKEVVAQMAAAIRPYIDIMRVAGRALVDEVIDPRETRWYLARALELSANKTVERPARKNGVRPV